MGEGTSGGSRASEDASRWPAGRTHRSQARGRRAAPAPEVQNLHAAPGVDELPELDDLFDGEESQAPQTAVSAAEQPAPESEPQPVPCPPAPPESNETKTCRRGRLR